MKHRAISRYHINRHVQNDILTDHQIRTFHEATLELLEDFGIKVFSEEALAIFDGAGAQVERAENFGIVKFPPELIEKCIQSAPGRVTYHGRERTHDYAADPGKVGFVTFGECIQIVDPVTRQIRSTTKEDLANITRLCDRLEEIVVVERPVGSLDQYPEVQPLHNYEAMVANTSKHVFLGVLSAQNARRIARMAAACVGGDEEMRAKPPVTAFVCPTSPLILGQRCCDVIIECARLGIGVAPISMVLSGTSAPVTLAGSIVVHNAEVLSAIALAQLTVAGATCTYASMSAAMDMRFVIPATGSPEHGLISAALTQLIRTYDIPCWVGGGVSDAKIPDAQAAHEFSLCGTTAALSGPQFVYGAGAMESGLTFDYAKLIMDCEQIKRIQYFLKGIIVNDETLALDVIKEVGHGGQYLSHAHTFKNMRSLLDFDLFDRRNRAKWMDKTGGRQLMERAYEKASQMLSEHEPVPLSPGAAEAIREIVEESEAEERASFA